MGRRLAKGNFLRMGHLWQHWLALTNRERFTLLQALLLLPMAGLLLRFLKYQTVLSILSKWTPVKERESEAVTMKDAQRLGELVNAAARRGLYDASCLRRSLVMWWMLRRRGIDSHLRVGVARKGEAFLSHAWVEWQGVVLNDVADIGERFITVI